MFVGLSDKDKKFHIALVERWLKFYFPWFC